MKELELYIHVPFCVRKCAYCDFLSFTSIESEREAYVEALLREIDHRANMANDYRVSTIFIGGGTPSVLEHELLARVMNKVRETFAIEEGAEISIEVNPGTVTREKVQAYVDMGINRVSIGLQATNNEELKMLGRIHTYEEFLETYELIREAGIENMNVDLISAIPKQTVESWNETLERIIALKPTHISAYSLIIEEGTLFYDKLDDYEDMLPSEEEEREMYHRTKVKLGEAGYHRYEISNYALEGFECKHNLGYWERVDYLGIGLGAASLLNNVRYSNERDMEAYLKKSKMDAEVLSREAQMEEFMFLGLRKTEGVSVTKFHEYFQVTMERVYGDVIEKLLQKELVVIEEIGLQEQEKFLKLTELGMDVSNYVLSEFII